MSGRRLVFILALVCLSGTATAQADVSGAAPPRAANTGAAQSWSGSLEAYAYLLRDDPFVLPIVRADRGALHLEARYQYENRETFSVWAGWSFAAGTTVLLEAVPMAGMIAGLTRGIAPGLEASLTWQSLELYSEGEYMIDVEGAEGDFFYNWSQLSWQARPWLACGASIQRTRMYQSELAIERGIFTAVSRGRAEMTVYGFNLDGDEPFAIIALGITF